MKIVIVTIVIQIAIICGSETVFSSSDISVTTTETKYIKSLDMINDKWL